MELAYRKGSDAFVPTGAYRELESGLNARRGLLEDIPAVVLCCFDRTTRLMPFVLYDRWMFPAGARTIAAALWNAGFKRTRAVFQLWNPNFRTSAARLDGKVPQILLISAMQIHSLKALEAVREAWSMGEDRPLILVGGPKAFHEPYHFWPLETPVGPGGADAVVTGEVYILMDLLQKVLEFHRPGEHIRKAYERARHAGALDEVPGLIYLDANATWKEPVLVDTGLQRLVQHLDELPDEVTGLSLLEPPHKGPGLSPLPLPAKRVRYCTPFGSLQLTQGCRFNCSYCPIPALNQKTWRFRSPENLVRQFRTVRETFGMRYYFGADDNFLNRRQTALDFFEALARARTSKGKLLGKHIMWGTEATQYDTQKNLDLLPLARKAGLAGLWFGIEDLTAELINKGQKPEKTIEVFREMHKQRISPMAMMMFHDGQPYYTPGSLYGMANQVDFLRKAGALSVQVTLHIPAIGTREYEKTYAEGKVLKALGSHLIDNNEIDGNHITVAGSTPLLQKQVEQWRAYLRFYNPINLLRAMRQDGSPLRRYRVGYQIAGLIGAFWHCFALLPHVARLIFSKPVFHKKAPAVTHVPVRHAPGAFPRFPDGVPQPEPKEAELQVPAKAA